MSNLTITATNSIYMLALTGLLGAPIRLQGFATDSVVDTDAVESAQAIMGVDGNMSVGYVPFMTKQRVSIMADSPSSSLFELWLNTQNQLREVIIANAVITLPSINTEYICTKGVLTSAKALPGVKKLIEMRDWEITWQSIIATPI
jgi:hypothetical protein